MTEYQIADVTSMMRSPIIKSEISLNGYLSFVNVGQTFYGFGWESLLLETGFFAIFLGGSTATPNALLVWILRWTLFRVMFGAGLIKLRGDPC
jgi:hypothetical protein